MPEANPEVMDFLLSRRSRPAKLLGDPAPGRDEIERLLTAAARSPDHGKLEPWRFIVLEPAALQRLAEQTSERAEARQIDDEKARKAYEQFANSPLCVAVVECQKDSEKIPEIEQTYSAGAVCLALLNAALASGWGANWLSGWVAHDAEFCTSALGLEKNERIAGFIHIGTAKSVPPERPRPDIQSITTWISE